jgi:hypothetical protein
VDERIRALLYLAGREPDDDRGGELDALVDADPALVDQQAESLILTSVTLAWDNGWQPSELVRHARRCDARAGRLVATAVAADHVGRPPSTLHPRWVAQLDALGLPQVDGATGWVTAFGRSEDLGRRAHVGTIVIAVRALTTIGRLQKLIPPPGAAHRSVADHDPKLDDPVLVRVRALLAQAESTTFEAEAEAFTAKAQQLMARHAIDTAMLWASSGRDERPTSIRLPIDDPYANIKSLLLQFVAHHSRCAAVWDDAHALSTVVGFAADVAATEMLFTSLLVQSQAALQAEARTSLPGTRARSRGFRSSFLIAFTQRIDQRLAEINAAVERAAQSERSESLLPVLASRDDAVQDFVAELLGPVRSSVVRGGSDAAGWARGRLAADLAKLTSGEITTDDRLADPVGPRSLGA